MKTILLPLLFFSISIAGYCTHIVGGELFMLNKNGYNYDIGLKLYFDDVHGDETILTTEDRIVVNVYRKSDNALMKYFIIKKINDHLITYGNPACALGNDLRTRLILYNDSFYLDPSTFNDPDGYYMVWQRCCRNHAIDNLNDPGSQGNTFYLEFPPVSLNGSKFTDSSPDFSEIHGDYACLNQSFEFDFSAHDADGDVLKYFVTTPFQGGDENAPGGVSTTGTLTNINMPAPFPNTTNPYYTVNWAVGYNSNYIIPVASPLNQIKINQQSGKISFTANKLGLYVFAIKCEEWRNNVKIGEVHRDFQIEVVNCQINQPPIGYVKNVDNTKLADNDLITVKVSDSRCFNLLLGDNFTNTTENTSNLKIRILKTNFDLSLVSLSPVSGTVTKNADSLISKLCWRNCAQNPPGQTFNAVFVVSDEGCPFPQTDTIRARFVFEPKPIDTAKVSTNLTGDSATVISGNNLSFIVSGSNPGKDSISIEAIGRGFKLTDTGMNFNFISGTDSLSTTFVWKPDCGVELNKDYVVDLILKQKRCGLTIIDTNTIHLKFEARPNHKPEIQIKDLAPPYIFSQFVGDTLQFSVDGVDIDNDPVIIKSIAHGFKLKDVGIDYDSLKAGIGKLSVPFYWKINCDNLNVLKDGNYKIDFIINDNSCLPDRFDTLSITIHIQDKLTNYNFLPYNIFTPNGDSTNQYFTMANIKNGLLISNILPIDNCEDQFKKIEIYNRWGKIVFESLDRNFRWDGGGAGASTFYYVIYYGKRNYKGWVALMN